MAIPGEQNEKGKDGADRIFTGDRSHVGLRRYPPAPNRAVNNLPFEERFRSVHLPMDRVWAILGHE